ncbi:MAG: hypothetical protein JWM80_4929 [Cyanobacteria bacterium RYN_339]|nr:hypothetical protein [Cyanobacteria bacterium RYN_339]
MPKPISVRPVTPRPVQQAKAQASPCQLIDRTMVAAAFDRHGAGGATAPDGIIDEDELTTAGVGRVDADARASISDAGGKISVAAFAKALAEDRVEITADGVVKVADGKATLPNGQIVPGTPWQFPVVQDQQILERFQTLVPRVGRYNPSWPDSTYYDRVFKGYEQVETGTREVEDGKNADGTTKYRSEPVYEQRAKYEDEINYQRLRGDLEQVTFQVLDLTRDAQDPELQRARAAIESVSRGGTSIFWGSEGRCRDLYNALNGFAAIQVPVRPETAVTRLNATLNDAAKKVDEQFRITADYPLDKVRRAVADEVKHLRGFNVWKGVGLTLGGAAAGAAGWFGLASGLALAGTPLIAATAGAAVLGLGLGFLVVKLIQDHHAKGLDADLATFQAITPEANRKELQQHALASYKLLQDARGATDLQALRAFEGRATQVSKAMQGVADKAAQQTKSLKTIEALVLKYAK